MVLTEPNRPICQICLTNPCQLTGKTKLGYRKYKKYCTTCNNAKYNKKISNGRRLGYILHKKDKCETCGFIPTHKCQLDVDHIDGNHDNNSVANLQTLCANCHRLKTYIERKGV